MKKRYLLLILIMISTTVWAKDFTVKEKAIIYNEAIKTLQNYQDFSNQLADAVVDMDESNKLSQKVIDLFVNRKAIIYNDLDPSHMLSEAYELETYVTNMLLWYPDGMKFNLDFKNMKAGNIIDHGNDIYTVDLMTSKKNDGNYLNKQKNEQLEELLYRIAFFQKGNSFVNYRIAGVRSSKSNNVVSDANLLAEIKSVQFSEKEMGLIIDQSKALLNDYINFINLLADPKESTEDKGYYRISFMGLFKDSSLNVANDIEPDPQKRWIPINEYEKNLVTEYPEGIRNLGLNLDSAQYGKVIPEGTNKYYINGYIDKFFSGKYQDKTIHRDNSKYDYKISFERDDNTFKNFKLASIDKFGINLYDQSKTSSTMELPSLTVKTLERDGLYYGLFFSGGQTIYKDANLTNQSELNWKIENKLSFSASLRASYYLISQLCISAGIGFDQYEAKMNLNGTYQNSFQYHTPISGDPYYKIIDANYDSTSTYRFLIIPVSLTFHNNKNPEKWGFYAEAGITSNIKIKATNHATGTLNTTGYFPNNTTAAQYLNNRPEYGLIDYTAKNQTQNSDVNRLVLTGNISIGITYPLDYYTTIFAGPEMTFGFSNLSKNKEFTDVFGNKTSAQKIGLSSYSLKFGISYKF